MERYSRRGFLAGLASVSVLGAVTRDAAAGEPPGTSPLETIPHIEAIRDAEDELLEYAPRLYVPTSEARRTRSETTGQYGWIAESSAHDVTAYYYWTRYSTQRSSLAYVGIDVDTIEIPGLGLEFGFDSHYLDHEPTIVFVNADGSVDSVVTTGGHHYAFEIDGRFGNFSTGYVSDRETHVNLGVVRPWNHYVEAPSGVEGTFVAEYADFGSWLDVRDVWYRNDRYADTATVAVEDPFAFYGSDGRTHWWVDGTWDAWLARHLYNRRVRTDELRHES